MARTTSIPNLPPAAAIPAEIHTALRRIDVRLRLVRLTEGSAALATTLAAGAVGGMAVEYLLRPEGAARWLGWSAAAGAAVWALLFGIVRPQARRNPPLALAALAERGSPELADRLTGSVGLAGSTAPPHGSAALAAAHLRDAAAVAGRVDPARAVAAGRPLRRLALGLALAAAAFVPAFAKPDPFRALLARFATPWIPAEPISRFVFVVEPGDKTLAAGSDLKVSARLDPRFDLGGGLPADARLEWTDAATGTARSLPMTPAASGSDRSRAFEASIPRVEGAIRYAVRAGSDRSRDYAVEAVPPPTVARLTVKVEPPAHTRRPPSELADPKRIEAIEGSTLTFRIVPSRPVARIALTRPAGKSGEERLPAAIAPDRTSGVVAARVDLEGSHPYAIRLEGDEHGLSAPPDVRRVVVRPDRPPTLAVKDLPGPKEAGPDDALGVEATARDDFGVASVEFHYQISRKDATEGQAAEVGTVPTKLPGIGSTLVRGDLTMPLARLKLRPGDIVRYLIRVADNRPEPRGPNVVWSEPYQLTIVEKAEPILARRDRVRREGVKDRIDRIKSAAVENRRETEQLRYAADAAKRETKAWDKEHEAALAAREKAAAQVRDDLRELARDLPSEPGFEGLAEPAGQIAELEAEAGRERLEHAKNAPDADARLEDLRRADARLGAVQIRLDELGRKFDALAKLDADRQSLRDLAGREEALADKIAEADAKDLDGLLAEQVEARRDLDALLARSPQLRAGALARQAESASKLAEKTRALAERQRDEARRTTDLAGPNEAMKALADEQRRIEEEARRLALDVDEPLAENGRGRLNVEPLRAAAEPVERGDVGLGRQRLEEAERELRRLAHDVADVRDDPKALARRLATRQIRLSQQVGEAVRDAKAKPSLAPDERAELAAKLKPLADAEAAVWLAAGIAPADPAHAETAKVAARMADAAKAPLLSAAPKEAEPAQVEARNALQKLSDVLPDQWRRQESARRRLDQANRITEEVSRDLERHLRETAPRAGRGDDPVRRAHDLARRLEPLVARRNEAAKLLAEMKPDTQAEPQRRRAERRLNDAAELVDRIRKLAVAAGAPQDPRPLPNWTIVGPFPMNAPAPFDVSRAVDPKAELKGLDGKPTVWKSVADGTRIDLGKLFGEGKSRSAFAATEIVSDGPRSARLRFGADDTLVVWVNGEQVHNSQGSRSFTPDGVVLDVDLRPGTNRIVAKIGNHADRWEFGASATPPPPSAFRPDRLEAVREAAPLAHTAARAGIDRLLKKMAGQTTADDVAEELASESAKVGAGSNPRERADAVREQKRLATALRNLDVPDAAALRAEAARAADAAAETLADPKADAAPALSRAAGAAKALADRLTDRTTLRSEAEALAKAQRGLAEPSAARSPTRRAERQKGLTDRVALLAPETGAETDAARAALRAARRAAGLEPAAEGRAPDDPAKTGEAAAQALDALAKAAPNPPAPPDAPLPPRPVPDDPDLLLRPEHVAKAVDLARRQRRLRESLQAIVGDRVEPQEKLRDEADELGREFAELRDESRETSPRGRNQAAQAADVLANQAPRVMEQGAAQLAEGKPREAKESQRRAAEALERGAQLAEDLAASLKAEGDALKPDKDAPAPEGVGDARSALGEVAEGLAAARREGGAATPGGEEHARATARARSQAVGARRAAESLRLAATGAPGEGSGNPADQAVGTNPEGRPIRAGTADLAALQAAVEKRTGRKWGELPGRLRSEILRQSRGEYRNDYSRLIQLYFQEIAAEAAAEKP